jgi:hypothetical protein
MILASKPREINQLLSKFRTTTLKVVCFALLATFLSGCSWSTNFVIANKMNNVLEVTYQFRKMSVESGTCFQENHGFRRVPSVKPISDLRKYEVEWQELKQGEYKCEPKELKIKFLLQPNMAVNIGSESNYTGYRSGSEYIALGIESLTLRGSGSIIYEGSQVARGFRKIEDVLYVLEYE